MSRRIPRFFNSIAWCSVQSQILVSDECQGFSKLCGGGHLLRPAGAAPEVDHRLDRGIECPAGLLGDGLPIGKDGPQLFADRYRPPLSGGVTQPVQLALGLIVAEDVIELGDAVESRAAALLAAARRERTIQA